MTLNNYLNLIKEQRKTTPKYPKDYRVASLPTKTTTSSRELEHLKKWPNAKLCNVIYRSIPLYPDVEDSYYFEYVDTNSIITSNFTEWRYFYIPTSMYSDLLELDRLPFIYYYDLNTSKVKKEYLIKQDLTNFVRPSSTFTSQTDVNFLHPMLSNFIFTGHSFLNKEGFMMYEYKDYNMYSDHISVIYYSAKRPKNFYINSNIAASYALETLTDFNQFIGSPPRCLELYNTDVPDLKFSGRTTSSSFSSKRRWYEYDVYLSSAPFDKILLPYLPLNKTLEFVDIELNNKVKSLFIPSRTGIQSIIINQKSSNNIISLTHTSL